MHAAGWSPEGVGRTLKIQAAVLETSPLVAVYGGTPWELWPPKLACERFLAELARLTELVRQADAGA